MFVGKVSSGEEESIVEHDQILAIPLIEVNDGFRAGAIGSDTEDVEEGFVFGVEVKTVADIEPVVVRRPAQTGIVGPVALKLGQVAGVAAIFTIE